MSAASDDAARYSRDLDEAAKKLSYFNGLRDKLKIELQVQSIEVSAANLEAINSKIAAEEVILAQRSQNLDMALAALTGKPWASRGDSAAATAAATLDGKIPLATQQEPAYIEEGNQGKGHGMTATYELIDETKECAEQTHESMVNAARRLRECEQDIRQLEAEAAKLAPDTPERQRLDFILSHRRKVAENYRFLVKAGRTTLDTRSKLLAYLEGEE